MVAGIVGGVAAAYWAHFGPEWRGWHWLSALVGGIVLGGIVGILVTAIPPRPQAGR